MKLLVERGDTKFELELSTEDLKVFKIASSDKLRAFLTELKLDKLRFGMPVDGKPRGGSAIGFQAHYAGDVYPGGIPEFRKKA